MGFHSAKGQGMSLNTIIIAAIVLIVLVVLWSIFTGRMGKFAGEIRKCRGECIPKGQCEGTALGDIKGVESTEASADCLQNKKTSTGGLSIPLGDLICCIKIS